MMEVAVVVAVAERVTWTVSVIDSINNSHGLPRGDKARIAFAPRRAYANVVRPPAGRRCAATNATAIAAPKESRMRRWRSERRARWR